jgi:hypothetical protein
MKTSEIIQRIQSLYSKGAQSDDSRLTSRHIYNKLVTVRSVLLSQQAKKKQRISQWNYQTIPCIELIKAPVHECPCLPPVGCEIYRSKFQLPEPLTDLNTHLIQSVSTITGEVTFSEIGWTEKKYKSSNKYTGNKPDYFIRNKYLYITYRKGPTVISVTAIFENPWEAEEFPSICDVDCTDNCPGCESPLDQEFPIDNDQIDTLIEMSVGELILMFSQSNEDVDNNTRDDQSRPQQYPRRKE